MLTVYGDSQSGNCYKIKLLLSLMGRPHRWKHVDILAGQTREPKFLARNLNGKIPVLELPDGRTLAESNAILYYLAQGSAWLPDDSFERAQVLQWQCFEQYSHEPYIAVARYIQHYLGLPEERRAEYQAKQAGGHKALEVMDKHLATQDWFAADGYSIADISLYAYTHVAHEGGFDLQPYTHINAWLERVAQHPRHVQMQDIPRADHDDRMPS